MSDGAIGTALYTGGIAARRSFEDLNRSDPDRVRSIHAAHLSAGAELISTNTFSANRCKLARHGLASEVAAINAAGAAVARSAAGSSRLVFGSVGPSGEVVGPFDEERAAAIRTAFSEQIAALLAGGVDGLLIETFTSLPEALLALGAAREAAPEIAVIVLLTFSEQGTTLFGVSPDQGRPGALAEAGADAVGSNCGVGPESTRGALERMGEARRTPAGRATERRDPGAGRGPFSLPVLVGLCGPLREALPPAGRLDDRRLLRDRKRAHRRDRRSGPRRLGRAPPGSPGECGVRRGPGRVTEEGMAADAPRGAFPPSHARWKTAPSPCRSRWIRRGEPTPANSSTRRGNWPARGSGS